MQTDKTLYFAYGSNMLQSRLQERVPQFRVRGVAMLSGYLVNYSKKGTKDNSGKFNIESVSKGTVYGVLFEIPTELMKELDKAEGFFRVNPHYDKISVVVNLCDSGRQYTATTYIGTPRFRAPRGYLKPTDEYADFIIRGAEEAELPAAYVQHLHTAKDGRVGAFVQ
jgi:gamma-glutamylcyclotransferase